MKNQFLNLQGWIPQILHAIKKDIKTEHLGSDPAFYRAYFGNRPQNRLTSEEIFAAYERELLKGNEGLGEWIVNRWVFKHGDLYTYFAEGLSRIHPDFEQIQSIADAEAESIVNGAIEKFGAVPTFFFTILNGVVFSERIVERLRKAAEKEAASQKAEEASRAEQQSLEQLLARHQREISRLQEKYESKLSGLQKKYLTDTEALKKQIRSLQQKLNEKKVS